MCLVLWMFKRLFNIYPNPLRAVDGKIASVFAHYDISLRIIDMAFKSVFLFFASRKDIEISLVGVLLVDGSCTLENLAPGNI